MAGKNNFRGEDKPREECGVFGIWSPGRYDIAQDVYYGLYALQHRGQESAGITVCNAGEFRTHKDIGLVQEVFGNAEIESLGQGQMAVGHVRYGTTGSSDRVNAQPITIRHIQGKLSTVHNGNLTNAAELRQAMELRGAIFHTTSDTEVISYCVTEERLHAAAAEDAVSAAMEKLHGAYSCILLLENKMIAFRDAHGFRPLCYGKTEDGRIVIASETCALDAVGAVWERDIRPGEIVTFEESGIHSRLEHCETAPESLCIFEYIYFARPDSVIEGHSVHEARLRAGAFLADQRPTLADVVIGVPDSGIDAAIGYSRRSGTPYGIGFIKNKYIGRTFIAPGQSAREDKVRIKLNPVLETVQGKRVVMVDDSIVRGTTCARIVSLLRDAGAKEVHVRITAPPFRHPCWYGTDIDSEENLIACRHSIPEICRLIGADTLEYLDPQYLPCLPSDEKKHRYCMGCFTGRYEAETPAVTAKNRFETPGDDSKYMPVP